MTRVVLLMFFVVMSGLISACSSTQTVNHPAVERSKALPNPAGYEYDKKYPARSEPSAGFYDYAFVKKAATKLQDAEVLLRRELTMAGWEFISQDVKDWDSESKWRSKWRQKNDRNRWDVLKVTFEVRDDPDFADRKVSRVIYQMNTGG